MFCSLMSVFLYFSGFEPFAPLERWCDFAKFWCGKKKLVAVHLWIITAAGKEKSYKKMKSPICVPKAHSSTFLKLTNSENPEH